MAVRNWHGGKVALVWLMALIATFFMGALIGEVTGDDDSVLFALIVSPFVVAIVLTWRWLSGREQSAGGDGS